ncbi:hypothetical protein [Siphonobacter sp. BAB-5385]|uniref:hypothetical protein n=1 Tax=Siphonobacter sp. BAB-5385 TaxID=1864822 RepID=UPI0020CE35C2|nr:hypothetical protein [Siphonobacter sp. BAB-5385]
MSTLPVDTLRPETAASETQLRPPFWTAWQKILFRIAFVFFVSLALPNDPGWYKDLFSFDWTRLHYRDLYDIARFGSGLNIFGNKIFGSPLNGYATWVITLIFAIGVGLVWTFIDSRRKPQPREYNRLYYWLRVVVRYRAGIGIIGFGYTKLFPTQLPYPSLGVLNTDFGDLTLQKIYWLSIGIVPWYEVFAGVVEVLAGALLFFRATTFWGSVLLFGALADIVFVNFEYDGGVHVYSSYFVLLSGFLLIYDIPKVYNLLVREQLTIPVHYYPSFDKPWQQWSRVFLKTGVIGVFVVWFFYLQGVNFLYDPYKQPALKGVSELRGNYNVTEFKINNQVIPYSPLDSVRWQQATFENWTTLTFKVNRPVDLDLSNGGGSPMRDINRTFELTGVAGGQRVFYYEADTLHHVLYLQDKNRGRQNRETREVEGKAARTEAKAKPVVASWIPKEALAIIGSEDEKIHPLARSTRRTRGMISEAENPGGESSQVVGWDRSNNGTVKAPTPLRNRMILNYQAINGGNRVILSGINENRDSIHVVLDRVPRKYALSESTLKAGKYD